MSELSFQPMLPWSFLLVGGVALAAWFAYAAWRGGKVIDRKSRFGLLLIRCLALLGVFALLSNPGRWNSEQDVVPPGWGLLVDTSASMAAPKADGTGSRREEAAGIATALLEASRDRERVEARRFSAALEDEWTPDSDAPLSDTGSRLDVAGATLLDRSGDEGGTWTGLVVLGDGRQTGGEGELDSLAAKARSLGVPVHVVPLGGPVAKRDLAVSVSRRQFLVPPNRGVRVGVRLASSGLPPVKTRLRLLDPTGVEKGRFESEVPAGETVAGGFDLPPESPGGQYRVILDGWEGDERGENDEAVFTIRPLEKRTRILLLEGAPYWDTKFLAQLLREQGLMDVEAVYRIQQDRFYRVSSGDTQALRETDEAFPASDAEMVRYDLIVIGKGADAFLTPERIERLGRFVRDRGGALLYSRGKPSASDLAGLATLQPGRWGEPANAEYTLLPTAEGEETGLFGDGLPGKGNALWSRLPPLLDVRTLAEVAPFTRVLAVGERVGGGSRVPLLMARRHGRGMIAAVNGDGLWRWGFGADEGEPEEAGEDWHREFWMQVLQWAATYSEFLPGEDFSLQLDASVVPLGTTLRARIGYRGETSTRPMPELVVTGPEEAIIPAAEAGTAEDGTPRWGAMLSPKVPGTYAVAIRDASGPGPSVPLTILPPPRESDELSADPATLEKLAAATGGRVWKPTGMKELLAVLEPERLPESQPPREATWVPAWNRAWILAILALLLGFEWAGRRRLGLI